MLKISKELENIVNILSKPIRHRTLEEMSIANQYTNKILNSFSHDGTILDDDTSTFFNYFECACNSPEHLIRVYYDPSDNTITVDMYMHQYRSFWKRLLTSVKYLFNYKCMYGHWDSFLLKDGDIDRLLLILATQKRKNNPSDIKPQLDDWFNIILKNIPKYNTTVPDYVYDEFDYSDLNNEDYDRLLLEVVSTKPVYSLLVIPGIYELLSEEFNNDVLKRYIQETLEKNKNNVV